VRKKREREREREKREFFRFFAGVFFFRRKKKLSLNGSIIKPGAGLPFLYIQWPELPYFRCRDRSAGRAPHLFVERGEGGRGYGGEERRERQQELFLFSLLFPCHQLFLFPFGALLPRAGLTTRLPYPRGSLPFIS